MSRNNERPRPFATPGISAAQITATRQMVELHTRGRKPNLKMGNPERQIQAQEQTSMPTPNSRRKVAPNATAIAANPQIQVPLTPAHEKDSCLNPQCPHCGAVIIPAPKSSLPIRDTPSIDINGWQIFTTRRPIFNAQELDVLEERYDIPLPEMVFGHNKVEIYNPQLNWGFGINTIGAMDRIKTHIENPEDIIKVSYANEWYKARQAQQSHSEENIMEVYKPYDWTYTTDYKGDEFDTNEKHLQRRDDLTIPLNKLTERVPILFFQEFVLYEDELGDNGISMLTIKIRCMKHCMLILLRFFLRVDNVLFRIHDTRFYVDFEDGVVIREFKKQESTFDYVASKVGPGVGDPRSLMRDSNWCSTVLQTISVERDHVQLTI